MSQTSAITPAQFITFGELLKFLRRRAGLSQTELSIAVGYSKSQISRLETNERAPDAAAIAARFVPELDLVNEPVWVARLLELAVASHAENEPEASESHVPSARHHLPVQLTSFVGREKELAELGKILGVGASKPNTPRLVTSVGPGGVGKTRLALQVVSELLDCFADGVSWIDLAPLVDATLIPQTVAHVLAVREQTGRPLEETLTDSLRGKKMLLVLDNCEHVIAASAQLAETLLSSCPDLKILATSREVLNIEGEQVFRVPSLSTPDADIPATVETLIEYEAVRLFIARAATVLPEFALSDENAAAVNRICRQLDGIPLAIELAAVQLQVLSLSQLADRLTDRFHLLTNGRRTALPRHQTLAAMIDWSYDLLTVPERRLLQRLAVFAGGWTLEAAEAVCVGGEIESTAVLPLLLQLVNKSLVNAEHRADQTTRYGVLETIRQYALAKLIASGEQDDVRRRHAEYYALLTETRVMHLVDQTELDNLRGALKWSQFVTGGAELHLRLAAGAICFGWTDEVQREAKGWVEGALAHANVEGVADSILAASVLRWLAEVHSEAGEYKAARERMSQSIELYQKLGDRLKTAYTLMRLGWIEREYDNMTAARKYIEEGLAIYRELGDRGGIAGALNTLGEVLVLEEKTMEAQSLLNEGLALFQALGHPEGIGWSFNHLGQVARLEGDYEHARQLFEASLTLFLQINPLYFGVAETPRELGETALAEGDGAQAKSYFLQVLALKQEVGPPPTAWCLAGLAGAAALGEDPKRAAWLWGAAESLRRSIGARRAAATRVTHERLMAQAREQLGEEGFAAAWAKGEATPLDEIITTILQPT